MFNVNPLEIVVIAVLVLVLFGPEKLPEMAVQLGKLYRDFRLMADAASSEFTREIQEAARLDAVAEAEAKVKDAPARTIAPPPPPEEPETTGDQGTIGSGTSDQGIGGEGAGGEGAGDGRAGDGGAGDADTNEPDRP